MGKSNRPLVVRMKPGQSKTDAIQIALAKPKNKGRSPTKILLRVVNK